MNQKISKNYDVSFVGLFIFLAVLLVHDLLQLVLVPVLVRLWKEIASRKFVKNISNKLSLSKIKA